MLHSGISLGINQITNRFGFGQLKSTAVDSPQRELARIRQPGVEFEDDVDDGLQQHRGTMTMQLDDVFAGE